MTAHSEPHKEHHIVTPATYFKVLIALMVLMFLTIFVAKWEALDFGVLPNLILALAIAIAKMTCIMLIFMHVKWSSPLVKLTAVVAFVFFGIMLSFTYADYMTRDYPGQEYQGAWHSTFVEGWENR